MDFQAAAALMALLLTSPRKAYKRIAWHKQTKGHWARDDPAFVVLLCAGIATASLFFGIALGRRSFGGLLSLVIGQLAIFAGTGVVMAVLGWGVANAYLRSPHAHSVEQRVEFMYAFDVHCNAYIPVFVILYLVQFLLLPVLIRQNILASLLGNTLWAVALCAYNYVYFLGYLYLPFLNKTLVTSMLYPVAGVFVLYVIFDVLNFGFGRNMLGHFFKL